MNAKELHRLYARATMPDLSDAACDAMFDAKPNWRPRAGFEALAAVFSEGVRRGVTAERLRLAAVLRTEAEGPKRQAEREACPVLSAEASAYEQAAELVEP